MQCKQLASSSQRVADPKENIMNQYMLSLQLLKKSLLPLQKAELCYVKCKDSTKQGNSVPQQEFLQNSQCCESTHSQTPQATHAFLASCPILIEVSGNFATD